MHTMEPAGRGLLPAPVGAHVQVDLPLAGASMLACVLEL